MKLNLVGKKEEAENIITFIFEPEEPITWEAGQFMIYSLPHENEDIRGRQRFFTISAPPFEKLPAISTRIFDKRSSFKKALSEMKIGDEILGKGPDGDFVVEDPKRHFVFLAAGIGITPYRSIILDLDHNKKPLNITLLYSNKTSDFPFKKEFDEIAQRNPSLKIIYLVNKRIDEKVIKENIKDISTSIFYVSGPDAMVDAISKILLVDIGIEEENIVQDYFSGYD